MHCFRLPGRVHGPMGRRCGVAREGTYRAEGSVAVRCRALGFTFPLGLHRLARSSEQEAKRRDIVGDQAQQQPGKLS